MGLIELLEQDLEKGKIELLKRNEQNMKKREAFSEWFYKAVEKIIEEQGAFYSGYEIPRADLRLAKEIGYPLFKITKNNPLFKEKDATTKKTAIRIARKSFKRPVSITPRSARSTLIWYHDEKRAQEYFRGIVTVSLSTSGSFILKLKEPFYSFFKERAQYIIA